MKQVTYRRKPSLIFFIVQFLTIGLLFFAWRLEKHWLLVLAIFLFVLLIFVVPKVVKKMEHRFHRKALILLAQGKAHEVLKLARKQVLLSVFGASAPIDAKMGLAYIQIGNYEAAADCLSHAIVLAPESEYLVLEAALTKSFFVIGDFEKAFKTGDATLERGGPRLPEVLIIMARSQMALGKSISKAEKYLDEVRNLSLSLDEALMLSLCDIEMSIFQGKKVPPFPQFSDTRQLFLKVWAYYVRGLSRQKRGKHEEALKSYAKAVKTSENHRFVFALLAANQLEKKYAQQEKAMNIEKKNSDQQRQVVIRKSEELVLRKKKKKR